MNGHFSQKTGRAPSGTICALVLAAALSGCGGTPGSSSTRKPVPSAAAAAYEEGKKALSSGDSATALEKFRESLRISERQNLPEGIATAVHSLAMTHVHRKEWRQALSFMERALAADRQLLEKARKAPAKNKLARAKIRIAETKVASDLNDLARIHQRLGEPEAALNRLAELLTIDLRLGREKGAAITHNNIGRIFLAMDDFEKAKRHYLVAMALFKKLKDEQKVEAVRRNLILLERIRRSRLKKPSPAP